MTLKSLLKHPATQVVVGVSTLALAIRYFGNYPVLEDIKKGLQGDTTAFNWFGFKR